MNLSAEEEKGAEEEEEEDGACEVGVVHYVLRYRVQRVENCECLWSKVEYILVLRFLERGRWIVNE